MFQVLEDNEDIDREKTPTPESALLEESYQIISPGIFCHFIFEKTPADKDSLFYAIGLSLEQDAKFLRQIIAAHMEKNFDEFKFYKSGNEKEFRQYIDALRRGEEQGDFLEIKIIQRITSRPVIIIGPNVNPIIPSNLESYENDPIFIYYNRIDHYDAFTIKPGINAKDILKNIQAELQQGRYVKYNILTEFNEHALVFKEGLEGNLEYIMSCNPSIFCAFNQNRDTLLHAIAKSPTRDNHKVAKYLLEIRQDLLTMKDEVNQTPQQTAEVSLKKFKQTYDEFYIKEQVILVKRGQTYIPNFFGPSSPLKDTDIIIAELKLRFTNDPVGLFLKTLKRSIQIHELISDKANTIKQLEQPEQKEIVDDEWELAI